jgi:peptidyl-dipeptidase Dcp
VRIGILSGMHSTLVVANPFLDPSPLPFQAPPFDRIRDEDYQIALHEGRARHLAEVKAIVENPEPPSFDNTIEALERSGRVLGRVRAVFHEIVESTATPVLRRIDLEEAPRLAAHHDAIHLDRGLFDRVNAVYDARDRLHLDSEARRLVERHHREFVRAGAGLGEDDQRTLRAINEEVAVLTTEFRERVLAATNDAALVVEDAALLRGLSPDDTAAAAEQARDRDLAGRYVLTLQNTTQQPLLGALDDRRLRQQLLERSMARCFGGPHDTTDIVARLARLRADRARLLGFASFAAFEIDVEMARTPAQAFRLLDGLAPPAIANARREAARLQDMMGAAGNAGSLEAHDWLYWTERLRRTDFAVDEQEVRPYFELERVLTEGVFRAATALYGVTMRERLDIPVYHPEVRVYEVLEEDGSPLALFYTDFFARPSKRGGAWSNSFVDQSRLLGTRPVVVNVMNVPKPAPGNPALLRLDDVETMFHEFGHALHAIFSDTKYPTLSGTSVPRDWVEFPSQFNEHWALDPAVFAGFARHHETGVAMPDSLYQRIKSLGTFNQGFITTEYLAAALLDLAWHSLPPDEAPRDVEAFERAALERAGIRLDALPPRYRSSYFMHIWGLDYAAGYYAYIWADVLNQDAYSWFQDHGGLTRENGERFRKLVLSRGDAEDPAAMFRALCGREPRLEPLLHSRGFIPQSTHSGQRTS